MNPYPARLNAASLLLRLMLAVVFFFHGAQKVFGLFGGPGLQGTVKMFTGYLHLPTPLAWIGSLTEFVVCVLLLLGFLTRPAAALLFVFMVVATILGGHYHHGFFMNWSGHQAGEGVEYNLCLMVMSLTVLILGGGAYSLDAALWGRRR